MRRLEYSWSSDDAAEGSSNVSASARNLDLGFDESCELAALVAGIRDDRFDRRKD